MSIVTASKNVEHELMGNHMTGLATPARGAREVEMWQAHMDAGAATPPHVHDHEEIVFVLRGSGRATVGDEEVRYATGDTMLLPAGQVHQIFAEEASEMIAAMPIDSDIRLPDGTPLDLPWRS